MDSASLFVLFVIAVAYLFDFINGFHDAANAIATIVTTGVLSPRKAVLWAAFFSLIAFLFFNLMVAQTVGHELIDASVMDTKLIFSALVGAILWNLLTWYLGLPSSSSHALIGGLAGAAMVKGGLAALKWSGFYKVMIGIFISPVAGLLLSFLLTWLLTRFLTQGKNLRAPFFRGLQLASSALLSLTHASNDAQKTMGIIAMLLFSNAYLQGDFYVPFWVVMSCQLVISLGTLAGGWRIVHTMGHKITHLTPLRGCTAETSAAAIILLATEGGVPVSTTQLVTGSIAGVGLVTGLTGTQWPMIGRILLSWLLTLPAAGLLASLLMVLIQ